MKEENFQILNKSKRIKTQEYRVTESPSYMRSSNQNELLEQQMQFQ